MTDVVDHVDVLLEGRMPTLRQQMMRRAKHRKSASSQRVTVVKYTLTSNGESEVLLSSVDELHSTPSRTVIISNVGKSKFYERIPALADEIQRTQSYSLVVAPREVVNTPKAQNFMRQYGRGSRLGFLIEDKPEEVTRETIQASLNSWVPFWLETEADERAEHPPYLTIRKQLSDEVSGRLDGSKIAALFGLSTAEMGKICGVTKQSFHANPTSKGIQSKLEVLAQVARGLLWCAGDEQKFRAWLNQPNRDFPEVEGKVLSPLDVIRLGHTQVIADKVQNMLTGHPA